MVKPRIKKGSLERVNLIPVGENQVLLVLVNDSGMLFHRILELGNSVDGAQLRQFEALLQSRLGGIDMEQLTRRLLEAVSYTHLDVYKRQRLWQYRNYERNRTQCFLVY